MPFKSHIDEATFKGLPEPVQKEYAKQDDGGYMLQVEGVNGFGLENVSTLRTSLEKERALTSEMKQKLKGLEDLNVEEARAALAEVKKMKDWKPDDKVKAMIAEKEKALQDKYAGDLEKATKEKESILGHLRTALVDGASMAALAKHGGNVAVLLPHMRSRAKLVEGNDGSFSVRFVDEKGTELLTRQPNSTDYMKADEFVDAILKKDANFQPNFKGVEADGFGSRKNEGGGGGGSGDVVTISSDDARDTIKYRRAREAAEKAGKRLIVAD